ncbi:MAG: hypothetical protein NTW46_02755 [Candidatus Nealsonbacteria bacterium]|nr:hypothetical protein [Candidatus Nealsonbacteria bacterium]
MDTYLDVPPLGWLARLGDILMIPLMYLLSGTFCEQPQRGHLWNRIRLPLSKLAHLNRWAMVRFGSRRDVVRCSRIFVHLPFISGWRHYAVLSPEDFNKEWYVGWILPDRAAVRRITLRGSVRMLLGPEEVYFFGIDKNGRQIPILLIGEGRIGDRSQYSRVPLL